LTSVTGTCHLSTAFLRKVLLHNFVLIISVVPSMQLPELGEEFDKESDIYEDPAVAFEGVQENPDPVDLDNYLVRKQRVPVNLSLMSHNA
jgi:hypothetical protein